MILYLQVGGRQEALVEVEADHQVGLEEEEVVGSVAVEAGGDKSHICVYTHYSISILLYTEIIKEDIVKRLC